GYERTTLSYDGAGKLMTVQFPDGSSASFAYPSASQVVITAPGSRLTTLTLAGGDLRQAADPVSATETRLRTFTYDTAHRVVQEDLTRGQDLGAFQQSWGYDGHDTLAS